MFATKKSILILIFILLLLKNKITEIIKEIIKFKIKKKQLQIFAIIIKKEKIIIVKIEFNKSLLY